MKAKFLEMDEFQLDKVAEFVKNIVCFVFNFIYIHKMFLITLN